MKFTERHTEILSPAGNMGSAIAACACGADAIYIGGERFSARASADNFTDEQIKEVVTYCHLRGVKVWQALNTVVFDSETDDFAAEAISSAKVGVDGFIVQDLGMAAFLKKLVPDMPIHASTQMTIHTVEGALLAKEMGFSRVVVSRELTLEQIKEICSLDIEVEAFVHGALCMSVSGQCYMSAVIGSRSANRGCCAQACRLPISAADGKTERHDLSLKDMCYAEYITALRDAGVTSFKIEGRMKRAEYVAAATTACRQALSGETPDMETLRAVFSRSGFTDGYLLGKTGAEMFGYRQKEDVVAASAVLPSLQALYAKDKKYRNVSVHAEIKADRNISVTMTHENITVKAEGEIPQKAINRPTDSAYAEKQLTKLGGTVFEAESFDCDIDDGLAVSASALNALRRECTEKLTAEIIRAETPVYTINEDYYADFGDVYNNPTDFTDTIHISHHYQLDAALESADFAVIPHSEADENDLPKDRIILAPPRFTVNESELVTQLESLRKAGFSKLYCNNPAHIRIGKRLGYELSGGYGLNITNSYSVTALRDMGLDDYTASFEMRLHDISALCDAIPCHVIIYGRLPLMLTRNCPVRQAVGCKQCAHKLTDRTGREFGVYCDKNKTYSEVFNSDVLRLCDRMNEIHGVSGFDYLMYDLTPDEIRSEMNKCKAHEKPQGRFTRGLYYRGII